MTDFTEIKGLVEQVNSALVPLRAEVDSLKASQKDVVTEAKFDKMAAQVTGAMEKLQAIEAKSAALEAAFQRNDFQPGSEGKDGAEAKAAFAEFAKSKSAREIEIRAMSTDVQPNGGYLVMPELSATVVSRIFETSPIRLVANIEQTGSKSRTFTIDDNSVTAYRVGERSKPTENTPAIGQKEIVVHNYAADLSATADLLADAYFDVSVWLRTKGAEAIGRLENTDFFTGSGEKGAKGLLTYAAWASAGVYERDKIEQIASGAATTFTAEGLIDTQVSLKEAYQPNAVWMMKRASFGAVIKLKGADNFYFGPMMLANGVPSMQLLGKRVIFADDMQAIGTGSNLIAAYGDFSRAYTILDRVGLQVLVDPFTSRPYTVYALTKRTGGDVTNFDAVKLTKASN
jgi:HK97 family phage major capsid protein